MVSDADHLLGRPIVDRDRAAAWLQRGAEIPHDAIIAKTIEAVADTPVEVKGDSVTFVGTSSKLDRDSDIIRAAGVDHEAWLKRPVILASHDARERIGRGRSADLKGSRWIIGADYYPATISPLAATMKDMLDWNLANKGANDVGAVYSIGFRSIKARFVDERRGVDFDLVETLEYSDVSIASNTGAQLLGAKAAGVGLDPLFEWCFKVQKDAGLVCVNHEFAERLRNLIDPSKALNLIELGPAHAAGFKWREPREQLLESEAGKITKTDPEEIPGQVLETDAATGPVELAFAAARMGHGAVETRELMAAAGYGEFAENLSDPVSATVPTKEQTPATLDHLVFGPAPETEGASNQLEAAVDEAIKELDVADLFAESHARITGKLPTAQ